MVTGSVRAGRGGFVCYARPSGQDPLREVRWLGFGVYTWRGSTDISFAGSSLFYRWALRFIFSTSSCLERGDGTGRFAPIHWYVLRAWSGPAAGGAGYCGDRVSGVQEKHVTLFGLDRTTVHQYSGGQEHLFLVEKFCRLFCAVFEESDPTSGHLRMPGQPLEVVGLVTRVGTDGLPPGFLPGNRVAVYLPMGYMIGGYTVFVPQEWVQPIEMSVEEAMRSSLIAWMARSDAPR